MSVLRQAKSPILGNREYLVVDSQHYHLIITSAGRTSRLDFRSVALRQYV